MKRIVIPENVVDKLRCLEKQMENIELRMNNIMFGFSIDNNIDIRKYTVDLDKGECVLKEEENTDND